MGSTSSEGAPFRHFWPFLASLGVALVIVIFGNISVYRIVMLEDLSRPHDDAAYLDKATQLDDKFLDRLHYLIALWVAGPSYKDTAIPRARFAHSLWIEIAEHENEQKMMAGSDDPHYRLNLAYELFGNITSGGHVEEDIWKAGTRVMEALVAERTLKMERVMANYIGFPGSANADFISGLWAHCQKEFENLRDSLPGQGFRANVFWTQYEIMHRPGVCETCLPTPTDSVKMLDVYEKLFKYKKSAFVPKAYLSHWTSEQFSGWSYLCSPLLVAFFGCLIYFTLVKYINAELV
ncbi:hypothetical protein QR680_003600 [Steinernema hermaphroditum]|uniref:Uncharacterized protein n=1 Tax=Steinernema hermaphroditum TaxID=289476 RepID=A0AA39HKX5_9BILA|nr:hypothetical protein QR680_003600 [Steinernema hermaphroditum]